MHSTRNEQSELIRLFEATFDEKVESIDTVRSHGSPRLLFRLRNASRSVLGVAHDDREENAAFIGFTRHFRSVGLSVPEILASDAERGIYLETDLGDESLAIRVRRAHDEDTFPEAVEDLYREVVRQLPRFQVLGHRGLDYGLCYQTREFDGEAMAKDLHYFRDYFLELVASIPYDADRLEKDFGVLIDMLEGESRSFFLYRDFQSRNVMIVDEHPRFIDYQSGRMGALAYDIASLLYDARADLGAPFREKMLDLYIEEAATLTDIDETRFREVFPGYVLIRILQALGAYGNLGLRQGKRRFLKSIPFALRNLAGLIDSEAVFDRLPTLTAALSAAVDSPEVQGVAER